MHTLENMKRRLGGKKGFTLLELLIVLLIIGILIAIGLYRYQSVVDAARSQEASAQVRAAFIAINASELGGGTLTVSGDLGDGITGVAYAFGAATPADAVAAVTDDGDVATALTEGGFIVAKAGDGVQCMGVEDGDVFGLAEMTTVDSCDGVAVAAA